MMTIELQEVLKKFLKYFIEGLAIAIAAFAIPKRQLKLEEVAMIALSGAATFAVLDMYSPEVASGARTGAGIAIGGKHAGGF